MNERRVDRLERGEWGLAGALALAGIGLAVGSQLLIVAATLPLWYVVAAVVGAREGATVTVRRRLTVDDGTDERTGTTAIATDDYEDGDDEQAACSGDPGDVVIVRTTVHNVGSEPIVDLRVVDGVPEALPVVSGSPRTCVTLEPGGETTLEYALELRRGEYAFDDATVRTRDLTGTVVETWTTDAAGDERLRCSPSVDSVPLGDGTNDYAGEVPTDEGSSGVEFYAVREYERGDPVGSIDWRRYASTRDLATVEYRAERATRVVCVVDARSSQFRAATTGRLPAIELSATAAERTLEALVSAGHPTGATTVSDRQLSTVTPGSDPTTRRRATELLRATWDSESGDSTGARYLWGDPLETLPETLPGEAQVYLFSSFVDDEPVDLVERLRAHGYAVRVISPDVAGDGDDVATQLEALNRRTRLACVRASGARVVDWALERPLGLVLRDAVGEVQVR